MNISNKLTLLRVLLIPVLIAVMMINVPWFDFLALGIFILAALTDFLDGMLARKYQMVTNFGKLMDPLADKLVVISVLTVLVSQKTVSAIPVIIIVMRELAVTGLRAAAASSKKSVVIPAGLLGKIKTITQLVSICFLIIDKRLIEWVSFSPGNILLWIATALTAISGVQYFILYKDCFNDVK